ncbi:MAG: hypothetical protein GX254_01190 [Clostridiales bacterium]|jgi:hypothetical protein|nr:hypothetical protein [Clostridiales bacterium]
MLHLYQLHSFYLLWFSAAILQEQGKINFFGRIQNNFPEFTGENKELLLHTSGLDEEESNKRQQEHVEIIMEAAKRAGFGKTNNNKLLNAY